MSKSLFIPKRPSTLASLVGQVEHKPLKQRPGYLQCPRSFREAEQQASRTWPAQYRLVFLLFSHLAVSQEECRQSCGDPTDSEFNPTALNHFQFAKARYYLYQSETWLKTEPSSDGSNAKTLTRDHLERCGRVKRKNKVEARASAGMGRVRVTYSLSLFSTCHCQEKTDGTPDSQGAWVLQSAGSASLGRERGRMHGVPVGTQPTVPTVLDNGSTRIGLGCFHSQTSTFCCSKLFPISLSKNSYI